MSPRWSLTIVLLALVTATTGCAFKRSGVTGLAEAQAAYYSVLSEKLTANRALLDAALTVQLEADRVRERNLLAWDRDLEKAEVILSQKAGILAGQRKLLYMKLAETDLNAVARVSALENIDIARRNAILALYDKLIEGAETLNRNNEILLKYLNTSDTVFALRSLDIDGIFRVIAMVESVRNDLKAVDARAIEEERKQTEAAQKAIERARDLLLRLYSK